MGCQVVSIYADQVLGKIGYPQQLMIDLVNRDHKQLNQIHKQHLIKINSIYGFKKSLIEGNIFNSNFNNQQYLIYNVQMFIIMINCSNMEQFILQHQNIILCFVVQGKLCVSGVLSGIIKLWDLSLKQTKLNIKLQTSSISSISFTKKFIFYTDAQQPNNSIYCYDIQTSKLKSKRVIQSIQPTLKGIKFGENHHITIGADGIWFCRYSQSENNFEITKGMFGIFPKTSMSCVCVFSSDIVVSGGVDGYIYLWKHYQCIQVYKINDNSLMSIVITPKIFVVSGLNTKTKCYSYTLKKQEQPQKKDQPKFQLTYSVLVSYQTKSTVQSIAISSINPQICYLQTKLGQIYNRIIPDNQVYTIKKRLIEQKILISTVSESIIQIDNNNSIYSVQINKINNKKCLKIIQLTIGKDYKDITISKNYNVNQKGISKKHLSAFSWALSHYSYWKGDQIVIWEVRENLLQNQNDEEIKEYRISLKEENRLQEIEEQNQVERNSSINNINNNQDNIFLRKNVQENPRLKDSQIPQKILQYITIGPKTYLLIKDNNNIKIYNYSKNQYQYKTTISINNNKQIIKIDNHQIYYDYISQKWKYKKQIINQFINNIRQIHQCKKIDYFYHQGMLFTIGNGIIITWKNI